MRKSVETTFYVLEMTQQFSVAGLPRATDNCNDIHNEIYHLSSILS